MSYSDRNTDMGTAKEHVEALLTYWHEGLHTLVARTENAGEEQRKTIDYKESVEKLSTLRKTVRLLTEYAKNISDVSVGSRYEHLCSVYDTWGAVWAMVEGQSSHTSKHLAQDYKSALDLLYNYMTADMQSYVLQKLVNDAVDDIKPR